MEARRIVCIGLAMATLLASPATAQTPTRPSDSAAALLQRMIGSWRIETLPVAGGDRAVTGTRTFTAGIDSLNVRWDEVLRGGVYAEGYLGFDPASDRFHLVGLGTDPTARLTVLTGTLGEGGTTIHWSPALPDALTASGDPNAVASRMVVREGSILWMAADESWAFELVRQ